VENHEITLPPGMAEVSSWEAFEACVGVLRGENSSDLDTSPLLFRGHADSDWMLSTTLERRGRVQLNVGEYYRIVSSIKPEIETFTGNNWENVPLDKIYETFFEYDPGSIALSTGKLPSYDYLAHLRHQGFPSPLLDWTRSPYVAAFFAFNAAHRSERVSLYAYCERPNNIKGGGSDRPSITSMGPRVKTHKRHFLQQSEYTFCAGFEDG